MSQFHIIATISAKPEHAQEVQSTLSSLVSQVHANEPQTLKYELFTGKKPGVFFVVEAYADKEALKKHGSTPYFTEGMKKIAPMLAGPSQIEIVRKVGGFNARAGAKL